MSVLLLKWQPTTDRHTVTLDAPAQALKRKATVKGKGHRQEARYCTKTVWKPGASRPRSPAHLCPSSAISTCGRLVGTRVQLMLLL